MKIYNNVATGNQIDPNWRYFLFPVMESISGPQSMLPPGHPGNEATK